uniref:Zinc finger CCCH domain-containing protein 14 n=3 Tax=Mesocestoides corti TaxID=53468 RepID=A0A5K3F3E9_MESCO
MPYSSDFLSEIKDLVKVKLNEIGAFADEELPDYIMVMVANKKKRESMIKDLQLFLGSQTEKFTNWLHGVLESKGQQKSSRKEATASTSSSKSSRGQKREKSKRSSHGSSSTSKPQRTRSRSRSPISPHKGHVEEPVVTDVVNVQTDENEFTEENALPLGGDRVQSSAPKPSEQRRVVTTSSLSNKNVTTASDNIPVVRSVVKISTATPSQSLQSGGGGAHAAAAGGILLKRAMTEARASTTKPQERPAAVVRGKKRPIQKSTTGDDASPESVTRFVVTMSQEPVVTKPSVKSRLGPRVTPSTNSIEDSALRDAREILIAKKAQSKQPRMEIVLSDSHEEEIDEAFTLGVPDDGEGDGASTEKKPYRGNIPSSLQRCKYWPNCRNQESCNYIHPKEECKAFPSCKFGDRCLYIHPPCRYGLQCTRPGCSFSHPRQDAASAPALVSPASAVTCRYFPHCKLPAGACPYYHPPTPVCRFGAGCLHRATTCPFAHPMPASDSVLAAAAAKTIPAFSHKLKWVAPGKSGTAAPSDAKVNPSDNLPKASPPPLAQSTPAEVST